MATGSPVQVTHHLSGIDFPATKQDLLNHAQGNAAPEDVIHTLRRLPDRHYASMAEVMEAYGMLS